MTSELFTLANQNWDKLSAGFLLFFTCSTALERDVAKLLVRRHKNLAYLNEMVELPVALARRANRVPDPTRLSIFGCYCISASCTLHVGATVTMSTCR